MALSLDQMTGSPDVGLPERTIRMCLAQKLVARVQALTTERADLEPEKDADGNTRNARVGDPKTARIAEIDAELADLRAKMDEHTGKLTIRAIEAGDWRRWADAHPVRTKGTDDDGRPLIDPIDAMHAYGRVNASDLLAELGTFMVAWNGDELRDDQRAFIARKAAPGDLAEVCKQVVQLHELGGMVPKALPRPSLATPSE